MGGTGFPVLETPIEVEPDELRTVTDPALDSADAHLRSMQAVTGYHLVAGETIIWHITDFLMDDQTWIIGQLVVRIGNRFSGHEVMVPPAKVERVSYQKSSVFVNMSGDAVEKSPAYKAGPVEP